MGRSEGKGIRETHSEAPLEIQEEAREKVSWGGARSAGRHGMPWLLAGKIGQ